MKRFMLGLLFAGVAFAQAPAPAGRAEAAAGAGGWPRVIAVERGSVEIFQPQIETFREDRLSARAAVAWTPTGQAPRFGVVWVDAWVTIDKEAGEVGLQQVTVRRVRFPTLSQDEEKQGKALLEREIPTWDLRLSLLDLQAGLAVKEEELRSSDRLDFTPPRMVFSQEPAVLLSYDGAPIERAVDQSSLRRVVNTPMLVLFDPATGRYYLSGGKFWYQAPAATGPFAPVAAPSPAVKAFVDRNPPPPLELEGTPEEVAAEKALVEPAAPPRIVVATGPTELFVMDGAPQYRPVGDDAYLLYVSNTQSHVIVDVTTGETYVLASGRWFKAKSLDGPWTNVPPDQLPAPFRDIPPDSDVGDVRTFIAGTEEAEDAVADSLIPQTAEVRRDQQFEPVYDGRPQFQPIEGTELAYAVNTPDSVVLDAGRYYACHQGVWYDAPTAEGPFTVSDKRPPHIDQVPPTVHIYNTRYVFVYRSTPQVVFVGYTPGYVGVFRHHGVVVFGTGFVYHPWVGPTVFFARPATFGFRVVYNPWTGFGFVVSPATPFMTVGLHFHVGFGPRRPPGWWGPVVYRPVIVVPPSRGGWHRPPPGFHPPPTAVRPAPPRAPAAGPGTRVPGGVAGGRPTAPAPQRPGTNIYNRPENRIRNVERPAAQPGRPSPMPVDRPNNVFGDRSGNVYRQNDRGNWERNTRQGWERQPVTSQPGSAARPTPAPGAGQRPPAQGPAQGSGGRPAPGAGPRPPAGGQPGQAARPAPGGARQGQAARPSPGGARGGAAPAGLGPDAAARQRSAPQGARPGGAGRPAGPAR